MFSAVGTIIFEERIGCFNDPMPVQAEAFLKNLLGFFRTMQPLMYNVPVYKMYEHKGWREYETYTDNLLSIGLDFVNKVGKDVYSLLYACTCTRTQMFHGLSIILIIP